MKLLDALKRALLGDYEALTLDHVPTEAMNDWRAERVKLAAVRFGKPFKCAADGVPRERFVGTERKLEVVGPKASVTPIRRKK